MNTSPIDRTPGAGRHAYFSAGNRLGEREELALQRVEIRDELFADLERVLRDSAQPARHADRAPAASAQRRQNAARSNRTPAGSGRERVPHGWMLLGEGEGDDRVAQSSTQAAH